PSPQRSPAALAAASASSPSLRASRKRPRRNLVRASHASSATRSSLVSFSGSIDSARCAVSTPSSPRFIAHWARASRSSKPAYRCASLSGSSSRSAVWRRTSPRARSPAIMWALAASVNGPRLVQAREREVQLATLPRQEVVVQGLAQERMAEEESAVVAGHQHLLGHGLAKRPVQLLVSDSGQLCQGVLVEPASRRDRP